MKFATINLNRKDGPVFASTQGVSKEEENNILVFALPTGEARHGAFKLVTLRNNFYVSYIELDRENNGKAAVIGVDIQSEALKFNPFALFGTLKQMVATGEIPDIGDQNLSSDQFRRPYDEGFKGGEYVMSSMFLMGRLIVVGSHEEIIQFLGTLYEATPIHSIPYLSCVSLVDTITDTVNIQGIEPREEVYQQLDDARRDSTIVILEENEAFGTTSSPFTKEIAGMYLQGKFDESKRRIVEFLALVGKNEIDSASDFARKHDLHHSDAKLLKQLQERAAELREKRKHDPYYKGVN